MYRPPLDPRDRTAPARPTPQSLLASYATMAAVPLVLWALHRPVAGAVVLASVVALLVGANRIRNLLRCALECQRIAFDLAGTLRITIEGVSADDCC